MLVVDVALLVWYASLRAAVVFAEEVMRQLERHISVLVLNYIEIQQSDT